MSDAAKVFLVDDDADVRGSIERLLREEGLDVVGFASGEEFLASIGDDAVGCVVLDLSMPGIDGLATQQALAARGQRLPIVFLTAHGGIPDSVRAVKAGAIDFLSKPVDCDDLLDSIGAALEQARAWRESDRALQALRARLQTLTPREREVFAQVIAGRLNKVIAERLGTSEQTIKVHRGRVMEKLEAGSVADLVRFAGLLGVDPAP